MTHQPITTEPAVHHYPARTLDGFAGQPGSEERLGKLVGLTHRGKALEARIQDTDRREAAYPMTENHR